MPNPKTGTVTMNVAAAVEEIKKGKVEYRVDKDGNVNVMIGKASFTEEALAQNFKALYDQLAKIKPSYSKGCLHEVRYCIYNNGPWHQGHSAQLLKIPKQRLHDGIARIKKAI
jgi:hypothetical protein